MQAWSHDAKIFESLVRRVSVIGKNILQQAFILLDGENLSQVLRKRDPNIKINEALLMDAAEYSSEATDFFLAEYPDITITMEILTAADSNRYGKGPIEALLRRIGGPVEISERVLMEVVKNPNKDIIKFLNTDRSINNKRRIESLPGNIAITCTEAILAGAARNPEKTMIELLLRRTVDPQKITTCRIWNIFWENYHLSKSLRQLW